LCLGVHHQRIRTVGSSWRTAAVPQTCSSEPFARRFICLRLFLGLFAPSKFPDDTDLGQRGTEVVEKFRVTVWSFLRSCGSAMSALFTGDEHLRAEPAGAHHESLLVTAPTSVRNVGMINPRGGITGGQNNVWSFHDSPHTPHWRSRAAWLGRDALPIWSLLSLLPVTCRSMPPVK
jgi:hypothetical protein